MTEAIVRAMPGQKREWTTVHFMPYQPDDFATGGQLISDGQTTDYFVEVTAPDFPPEQIKAVVAALTPLMADTLGLSARETYKINIKCNSYDPANMAIGGRFLSNMRSTMGSNMGQGQDTTR
jgi:phenylpyruvate tautomerase PptA (4-oxalocrotonate tautomerase family)